MKVEVKETLAGKVTINDNSICSCNIEVTLKLGRKAFKEKINDICYCPKRIELFERKIKKRLTNKYDSIVSVLITKHKKIGSDAL